MRAYVSLFVVFLMAASALAGDVITERDLEKKYGSGSTSSKGPDVTTSGSEPLYYLKLENYTTTVKHNYIIVEGLVTNISGKPLKYVQVVVMFFDASNNFISSKTTFIKYNPILPGQSCPFKLIADYNPDMKGLNVSFKEYLGGELAVIR